MKPHDVPSDSGTQGLRVVELALVSWTFGRPLYGFALCANVLESAGADISYPKAVLLTQELRSLM